MTSATFIQGQLSEREAELLASYRLDGPTLWDASKLLPYVDRLKELGLIFHSFADESPFAFRLTDLGSQVLAASKAATA